MSRGEGYAKAPVLGKGTGKNPALRAKKRRIYVIFGSIGSLEVRKEKLKSSSDVDRQDLK